MSPLLSKNTNLRDLELDKYVRVGNVIAYDEPVKSHARIAEEHGIGTPINEGLQKMLVDDAGEIFLLEGEKVMFGGHSSTCRINGLKEKAVDETNEIARNILGRERVY